MILRVFRVRGATGDEGPILRFVTHTLGNRGTKPRPVRVDVARRFAGGSVEVVVVSVWKSWEDIQAWTGPDVSKPLDTNLPAMFESRVDHYESVDLAAGVVPDEAAKPAEGPGKAAEGPGKAAEGPGKAAEGSGKARGGSARAPEGHAKD